MDKEQLKRVLPHREPMLLVDEVTLSEDSTIAYGRKEIIGDEWFVQGHFPENPVVPGVIICEIMAQTCCMLLEKEIQGKTPYFMGIDKVRFKAKVRPGDEVRTEVTITRSKGVFYFARCKAFVRERIAALGDLSFALIEGR